jgi:type VI secretion system protein ImpM
MMGNGTFGCFGKLPIHSDFIRFRASGEEVRALDQWLQEGLLAAKSRLGRGWEADYSQADPWNFVFQVEGTDSFLIGSLVPSRDQAGRSYPFFLFLRVDRKRFAAPIQFAPITYASFLDEATTLARSGGSGMRLKEFLDHLERLNLPIPDDRAAVADEEVYRRFLQGESSRVFWTTLFGEFEHPKKYQVDQNLLAILGPMRGTSSSKLGFGLTFPLIAADKNRGEDIPLWIDLIARMLKRTPTGLNFFWNRMPTKGIPWMMLFLGPPSAKSFLSLISPNLDGGTAYELAPETAVELPAAKEKVDARRRAILENGEMSLAAFLEAIGTM